MEKIRGYNKIAAFQEKIMLDSKEWTLISRLGNMILLEDGTDNVYWLDRATSNIPNVTLIKQMIKEKQEINFRIREDNEKCLIRLKTAVEELIYIFQKIPLSVWKAFQKESSLVQEKLDAVAFKEPHVGLITITTWKEYSLVDLVSKFDYSFLNLKETPVILLGSPDGTCFASAGDKTNSSCTVYMRLFGPPSESGVVLQYCIFPNEESKNVDPEVKQEPNVYDESLNSYIAVREANKNGRLLVVYEDRVIDAERFLEHHPGLVAPLKVLAGREMCRWFFGARSSEDKLHQHTDDADHLMFKYQVGKIRDVISQEMFHIGIETGKDIRDFVFVSLLEIMTDVHTLVKLSFKKICSAPLYNNVSSFGRYYSVYSPYLKMNRNYCCVLCAADKIYKEHLKLCEAIKKKVPYATIWEEMEDARPNYIPLIVKAIGKFSTWMIQEAPPKTKYIIRGPFVILYMNMHINRDVDLKFRQTKQEQSLVLLVE